LLHILAAFGTYFDVCSFRWICISSPTSYHLLAHLGIVTVSPPSLSLAVPSPRLARLNRPCLPERPRTGATPPVELPATTEAPTAANPPEWH
jgi:hypothetical protein